MKILAGLLAFAVALAAAVALTKYYSTPTPKQSQQPAPPPQQQSAPAPPADARSVAFMPQGVTLDIGRKKANVTLALERDPARPAPEKIWVWVYFFTPEVPGRYCAGDPVEVSQPFGGERAASVDVQVPADCPAPRGASTSYYARVNVSAESAFAARLGEQRISYDAAQASPVKVTGTKPSSR